jgi:transcriptional regulatory protein RtcR
MAKRTVVFSLLGTTLDAGKAGARWERWRPSVAMCQHDDLMIERVELLHQARYTALAEQVAADIAQVSPETTVQRAAVEFKDPWDLGEVYAALLDVARGYRFRPEREDYLVHITTGSHIAQICLFLLTEARYFPARLLQTSPPDRGGRAGPGTYRIIDLDLSTYDPIASRFRREQAAGLSHLKSGIATRNAPFNRLIERLEKVAGESRDPILLLGPTGAGKSQLARRIFELKKQRRQVSGELVEVNCATVAGDGAMSALFGHVRGAFTGAVEARPGLLRKADGGLLFLDEIGELGLDEQAMLLRAVEQKRFYPVGGDREVASDFQLLAGTNRDLRRDVAAGRFREDLLARIDLWCFRLPALRDRPEDIEPNLDYELEQRSLELNLRVTMSKEARARFLAFARGPAGAWRGNFRDLNAATRRMAAMASGGRIGIGEVDDEIARLGEAWQAAGGGPGEDDGVARRLGPDAAAALDRFERVQLAEVLRICAAARSLSEAGRALFAASRARKQSSNDADRLRKYLARFGLSFEAVRG